MIMSARVSTAGWRCPYLKADLSMDRQDKLCFRFDKKSRYAGRVNHHFSDKLFRVTDAYRLPLHIQRSLEAEVALVINAGVYPIVETNDYWLLEVRI